MLNCYCIFPSLCSFLGTYFGGYSPAKKSVASNMPHARLKPIIAIYFCIPFPTYIPNRLRCFIDLRCEAPSKTKNSRQKSSDGRSFNSVVTYTCKPPFKLRGSSTRTCRAIGKWDGKKARCSEYL